MVSRLECSICFDYFDDFERLPKILDNCGHTFCYSCLDDWLSSDESCPMCRLPVDSTQEIPTNLELLAVFEQKKTNPKCNCHESRMHYCPTCLSENYANWEERRDSGEHMFCLGCAWDHFHDMEHIIKHLDSEKYDINLESGISKTKEMCDEVKERGGTCRKVLIGVSLTALLGLSIAFVIGMCLLFEITEF